MIGAMLPRPAGRPIGDELRRLAALAGPVVVAEVGWMTMGLVDTVMVGPLGPAAIGAVGLGGALFMALGVFGMGLLLGLDTLVSQAFGAGRLDEGRRWLVHGVALAALLTLPMMLLGWSGLGALDRMRIHPEVVTLARPYLEAVVWSLPPLLGYAACRRYLQGVSVVRPIAFALVTANLLNAAANWALIYGHLGLPALGVRGAAWATVVARIYMAGVLAAAVVLERHSAAVSPWRALLRIELRRLGRLTALGFPAAAQITLEVGVFAAATALAGRIDPVSLAAHQIALNVAGFVYMVPLGVASAGAVLVGQAVGARDPARAARAGWTALGAIACFMALVAVVFLTVPQLLLATFTRDARVVGLGTSLLAVAALFQLFDGLQVVATGILRGVGDTRVPMAMNLAAHWLLGLPVGYALALSAGWGVVGLWIGLSVGLISVGIALTGVWAWRARALVRGAPAGG